jgi:hypothetical protein
MSQIIIAISVYCSAISGGKLCINSLLFCVNHGSGYSSDNKLESCIKADLNRDKK